MSRILVTYYSRTGYTRQVAEQLAKSLGASLLRIEEVRSRAGPWGYLRSAWEALRGREADIGRPPINLQEYDLVVLGTPVWAGHASSPARTFARHHGSRIDRVGLFCTLGGSGDKAALDELQRELHHTPLATLALTDSEIDAGVIDYKLTAFAAALRAKLPAEVHAKAA